MQIPDDFIRSIKNDILESIYLEQDTLVGADIEAKITKNKNIRRI